MIIVILLILTAIITSILYSISKTKKKKREQEEALEEALAKENAEQKRIKDLQRGLPILDIPSLYLGDAKLRYYETVVLIESENKLTGFNNSSTGFSRESLFFHDVLDTHVTYAQGNSEAVYDEVVTNYMGELAITDEKIIFINPEKGFDIDMDELTLIKAYDDGISLQSGENTYTILVEEPRYCTVLVNTIKKLPKQK